jgi:hypothetical protein
MKNSLKALVVVAILAIAGMASAQNSANANGTANATIVCPISIVNTSNLQFGTITNTATGGNVVIPANGAAVYTTVAATTGSNAGPAPHSANFNVGGQGAFSYSVAPTIVTNFGGTGASLSLLTYAIGPSGSGGSGNGVFPCDADNDGDPYEGIVAGGDDMTGCGCVTDVIKVGGKLTLTSAANGVYSATINVAIAYN